MSDWNLRKNRNFKFNYYAGEQVRRVAKGINETVSYQSPDTKNRKIIMDEIEFRIKKGEKIDEITTDIAGRDDVKEKFGYLLKHGISDLSKIFKGWYEAKQRNKEKLIDIIDGRW